MRPLLPFTTFSPANRRLLLLLVTGHLLWSCALFGLWAGGRLLSPSPWVAGAFIAVQLYAAAQLLLPALLHPEARSRSFYLFWGGALGVGLWLLHQIPATGIWLHLLAALKSGFLLFAGTLAGTALARYLHRLWEILPVCVVMTLADFASWQGGPTATFAQQIQSYYLHPEGAPPLVDMILIKFALPGAPALAPLFGLSDWVMVVFFTIVARRHGINDNLFGPSGTDLAATGKFGSYLPVAVLALLAAILLAQVSGLFLPALPLIALCMLLWYSGRYLWLRRRA